MLALQRLELRVHVSWEATLPWQSQLLAQTHEELEDGTPSGAVEVPAIAVRRGEAFQAALHRGLASLGLEQSDLHLQPRMGREVRTVQPRGG